MDRRPRVDDTEEDILRLQESFLREKAAATVVRVQKQKPSLAAGDALPKRSEEKDEAPGSVPDESLPPRGPLPIHGARFTINLDAAPEDVELVLGGVQELWTGTALSKEVLSAMAADAAAVYSKEDGFPEPLDLRAYFTVPSTSSPSPAIRRPPPGVSFFAAEFDRLNGRLTDAVEKEEEEEEATEEEKKGGFEADNAARIAAMSQDELERAREEIKDRIDPAMLAWLRDRHKAPTKEGGEGGGGAKRVSRFKKERQEAKSSPATEKVDKKDAENKPPAPPPVDELIGNLELLDEYGSREDQEKYDRLAIEAVRVDMVARSARHLVPRQEAAALRIFDALRKSEEGDESIISAARAAIDEIRSLYVEQLVSEEGRGAATQRFTTGSSPLTDSCWMLAPLRRILDDVHASPSTIASPAHIDAVRLCLLWTELLRSARPHAFATWSDPAEAWVRVCETFLLGPTVFNDSVISACLGRFFDGYLVPAAAEGRLLLRTATRIAGIDAVAPFFDDLLRAFEATAMGSSTFAVALLLPAYLNASLVDGLHFRVTLWSSERSVARVMTLGKAEAPTFLASAAERIGHDAAENESSACVPYAQLIGAYLSAIQGERVSKERNGLLWALAERELGLFTRKHSTGGTEFAVLVDVVRRATAGIIEL